MQAVKRQRAALLLQRRERELRDRRPAAARAALSRRHDDGQTPLPRTQQEGPRPRERALLASTGKAIPKDKAIKRFIVRNIVDASSMRDIRDASAYETYALPKIYIKQYYCIEAAPGLLDIKQGYAPLFVLYTTFDLATAVNFAARDIDDAVGSGGVFAIDVDGDGDVDVLSASYLQDTIGYENDGSESFAGRDLTHSPRATQDVKGSQTFSIVTISTLADQAASVADRRRRRRRRRRNVASVGDDAVAWYENDGAESFAERVMATLADGATSVFAIDADGDVATPTPLSASYFGGAVAWHENDGSESFAERVITTLADGAMSVFAIDVDEDGDVDVLSGFYYHSRGTRATSRRRADRGAVRQPLSRPHAAPDDRVLSEPDAAPDDRESSPNPTRAPDDRPSLSEPGRPRRRSDLRRADAGADRRADVASGAAPHALSDGRRPVLAAAVVEPDGRPSAKARRAARRAADAAAPRDADADAATHDNTNPAALVGEPVLRAEPRPVRGAVAPAQRRAVAGEPVVPAVDAAEPRALVRDAVVRAVVPPTSAAPSSAPTPACVGRETLYRAASTSAPTRTRGTGVVASLYQGQGTGGAVLQTFGGDGADLVRFYCREEELCATLAVDFGDAGATPHFSALRAERGRRGDVSRRGALHVLSSVLWP
ncbi:hypothetical protein SO694_00008566 [Aureococcus anophagefferens]|uniref:Uncharacterized protein n=1 Tax=Aureococcus anophagefferens TaxID=44056 RepID=A0ABR1GDW7_AURAN